MIIGLPRWDDPDAYYSQENNAIEEILQDAGNLKGLGWLETCGPTAAINILAALGVSLNVATPGGWNPQPEDVLSLYLNDPRNHKVLGAVRADVKPDEIMGNRVPQYYPTAIKAVFNISADFAWGAVFSSIVRAIDNQRGVMLCMKKPGHYIAVVAYDRGTQELIYNDPWPGNSWPLHYQGKPGKGRRLKINELNSNIQSYRVEIG
jgi:hypothetical protein